MPVTQKLSEVVNEIEGIIRNRFAGRTFWIKAEITDVKKYADKRWCFLKFIEKSGNVVTSEIKGVFWSGTYYQIEQFESAAQQSFSSGLEITCNVGVRFHKRYGLTLEVLAIDFGYAIGKLELERKQTIERLINEQIIRKDDATGLFYSMNNCLELPIVIQRIALITAPDSDGQRDFQKVLRHNKYGYAFSVTEFLTRIQGDDAGNLISQKLRLIAAEQEKFDIVVIVRGGGSDTDFKCFNDFELAKIVATFPLPVLTGIEGLKERFSRAVSNCLERAKNNLEQYTQRIKNLSPTAILRKGFAIITIDNKIITDPANIPEHAHLKTILKNEIIHSTVTKKTTDGKSFEL